jgi:hypothetical protein
VPLDEIEIRFNPAAFKHYVSEADIRFAIENFVYDEVMEDDEEKRLLIGLDLHVHLLEIIYNVIDAQTINVFHAKMCRKTYLELLDK